MKFIDVSSNNGHIDWKAVKNAGITDVFIRLSLGYGEHDVLAVDNALKAHAEGINVSYYHLAYPDKKTGATTETDALNEANYFVKCIKNLGIPFPKFVAVDLETRTPLVKTEYASWLRTWLESVHHQLNIIPVIYTYADYLNTVLPPVHDFGKYPLWIANYNNVSAPKLPHGWNRYFLWQFSETGTITGINTKVDLSKEMA